MRKMMVIVLSMILVLVFAATVQAAPKVVLDGKTLTFDTDPVEEQGRILVPLRIIFEALGATVGWDEATQTVTAQKDGVEIKLVIGGQAYKNNQAVSLDVPAKVVDGRTLVPIRFVSEALGATVGWENGTVTISSIIGETQKIQLSTTDDYSIFKSAAVDDWFLDVIHELDELSMSDYYLSNSYLELLDKIHDFEIPKELSEISKKDLVITQKNFGLALISLVEYKSSLVAGNMEKASISSDNFINYYDIATSAYLDMCDRLFSEHFGDSWKK